jgi:hypothetical protein
MRKRLRMNQIHRYDQIREMPTVICNVHESIYSRSYHILMVAKDLLSSGVPSDKVLEIIQYLETPLPTAEDAQAASPARDAIREFEDMRTKAGLFDIGVSIDTIPPKPNSAKADHQPRNERD